MSVYLASTSKQTARLALAARTQGGLLTGTTTSAGAADGTNAVLGTLANYGDNRWANYYPLFTSGDNQYAWRRITTFDGGVASWLVPLSTLVASGVTWELYRFPVGMYTTALQMACSLAFSTIHRQVPLVIAPNVPPHTSQQLRYTYALPSAVRDVWQVTEDDGNSLESHDGFERDDSASSAGGTWTAVGGTWGVSSNRLYSATDANGNLITQTGNPMYDGVLKATVTGTLASGTAYRSPALVFRYLNSSNYLVVRLLNNVVDLRKVNAGTESSLTTASLTTADGTDYQVTVRWIGASVQVWVNDTIVIDHLLTGAEGKYLGYGIVGVRWDKSGSPATAARLGDWRAYRVVGQHGRSDWQMEHGTLRFGTVTRASGLSDTRLLSVDGAGMLTAPANDTVNALHYGTLAADTTAVLEIATSDPAWELFLLYAAYHLYSLAARPGVTEDVNDVALYKQEAAAALQDIQRMRVLHQMPRPKPRLKHGGF